MTWLHPRLESAQRQRIAALLTLAQLGYAHWFFGNLYEAVVRVPDRLAKDYAPDARDQHQASVLSPGSPVRYYLPGIPVVVGATLSALVTGWRSRTERPWLCATAVSALSGVVATVYLVRTVNLKLFVADQTLPRAEQDRLPHIWYRVNLVRLVTTGGAWLIAQRIVSRLHAAAH
jgi:hypothetical protein